MTTRKSIYLHESTHGMNTFKTQVFEREDGKIEAVFTRIKRKRYDDGADKFFEDQVTSFIVDNKEDLKKLELPKLRSTKILLNSDFFDNNHDN